MAWEFVGIGGSGAGFQLFKKSTDGQDAIFADASARDTYFAANPSDLALLDADQFKIIKLLDNGAGEVAYQQRQASTWVDVTSLVQGEQGPAGATGNSFFFTSIADRDTFFDTNPNEGLLETGLPIAVNVGSETLSNYIWNGPTAPVSYDPDLWVLASIQVSSGTVYLGQAGASLSSGNEVVGFNTAGGTKRYLIGIEYQNSGSITPSYWELSPITTDILSPLFTQTLTDPQSVQYQFTSDEMLIDFRLRPATAGELRIEMWLGTDDTGAQLIDSFFTVTAPDIGNEITYTLPNNSLITSSTNVYITLSGVQLFGDLQTSGPFNGLTVPAIAIGIQAAISVNFVANISGSLLNGEIAYGGTANFIESEPGFFWNNTLKNLGVNQPAPDTTLHVDSQAANTEAITKFENTVGFIQEFVTSGTPEGVITAAFGARATDLVTGDIWVKESASGNTGWVNILSASGGVSGPASSLDNEIPAFSGTTGKVIKDGTYAFAITGESRAHIDLQSQFANTYPTITFSEIGGGITFADITYKPDQFTLEFNTAGNIIQNNSRIFDVVADDSITLGANLSSNFTVATGVLTLEATANNVDIISGDDTSIISGNDTSIISGTGITLSSQVGQNITNAEGDDNAVVTFTATGTNGAAVEYFFGSRDPEGLVSALPGAIYSRNDGINSNLYQLHSAGPGVANTPWIGIAQGPSAGDVTGPGSAVDSELAIYNGITGKIIKAGTQVIANVGTSADIKLKTTLATAYPSITWEDNLGTSFADIQYEPDTDVFSISSPLSNIRVDSDNFEVDCAGFVSLDATQNSNLTTTNGILTLESTNKHVAINAGSQVQLTGTDGHELTNNAPDTSKIVSIESTGTNGADTQIYSGDRDPEGNITASPGSFYSRIDALNSGLYQYKAGAVGNTGWQQIGGAAQLTWGNLAVLTTTTTRYMTPQYDDGNAISVPIPTKITRSGTARVMTVSHGTPLGNGNAIVYTLRVNSVATALSVSLASNGTFAINTTDIVQISENDTLDLEVTKAAAIGSSPNYILVNIGFY